MTTGGCILNARILADSLPVLPFFSGFNLQSKQCDHDQQTDVKIFVSDLQWHSVVQQSKQFVVLGGHYHEGMLDCTKT